jgi:hypothetical protein
VLGFVIAVALLVISISFLEKKRVYWAPYIIYEVVLYFAVQI